MFGGGRENILKWVVGAVVACRVLVGSREEKVEGMELLKTRRVCTMSGSTGMPVLTCVYYVDGCVISSGMVAGGLEGGAWRLLHHDDLFVCRGWDMECGGRHCATIDAWRVRCFQRDLRPFLPVFVCLCSVLLSCCCA